MKRPLTRSGRDDPPSRTRRAAVSLSLGILALVLVPGLAQASTITTSAGPSIALGAGPFADQATVIGDGIAPPTGEVTFELFGPSDPMCLGLALVTADTQPLGLAADGTTGIATSAGFVPTVVGDHHWRATYSGDANNAAVGGSCNDPGETQTVTQALPTITTAAPPNVTLGAGALSDSATVNGLVNPSLGQSVTFQVFGPDNASCDAGTAVFTRSEQLTVDVSGTSGTVQIQPPLFQPPAAGVYRWIATYNGDPNNATAVGSCGEPTETQTVAPATPAISTVASPDIALGGQLSDTATVSGLVNPPGRDAVTFELFGPDDSLCAGPALATESAALVLDGPQTGGTAVAANVTPASPGVYRWRATFEGDANNAIVAGTCGGPAETTTVAKSSPTITTVAGADITFGEQLSDDVTVSGLVNPSGGGNVTFNAFGPNDPTCAGDPVFSPIVTPLLNLARTSATAHAAFTPTAAGIYRWKVVFNGDANNAPVEGVCSDPAERQTVTKATPGIETHASSDIALGAGQLLDAATVTGVAGVAPTGTVTFQLFGPDDPLCSGGAKFTDTQPLTTDGATAAATALSGGFTPPATGVYRWVASYLPTADLNYQQVVTPCNDANESAIVSAAVPPPAGPPPAPPPPPAPAPPPAGPAPPPPPPAPDPAPGPARPLCNGKTATIVAAPGQTALIGTAGPDVIVGDGTAETIDGGAGDDTICAGGGADTIRGGAGNDTIVGGNGKDTIRGDAGDDVLTGDGGDDLLLGGAGDDDLRAGSGNDRAAGGDGADIVDGGSGNDVLDDQKLGGRGRDHLFGGTGSDRVRTAGGSTDAVDCGSGRDSVLLDRNDSQKRCERTTRV